MKPASDRVHEPKHGIRGRFWLVPLQAHPFMLVFDGLRRYGNNTCRLDDGSVKEYTHMTRNEDESWGPYEKIGDKIYLGKGEILEVRVRPREDLRP